MGNADAIQVWDQGINQEWARTPQTKSASFWFLKSVEGSPRRIKMKQTFYYESEGCRLVLQALVSLDALFQKLDYVFDVLWPPEKKLPWWLHLQIYTQILREGPESKLGIIVLRYIPETWKTLDPSYTPTTPQLYPNYTPTYTPTIPQLTFYGGFAISWYN